LFLIAGWRFNLADKELFDYLVPLSDASFSVTLFYFEPVSLFQSAIGDFTNFLVVYGRIGLAYNGGSLTIGRNSNLKISSVHDLSFETCRHPPKSSSCKRQMVNQSSLTVSTETRTGRG